MVGESRKGSGVDNWGYIILIKALSQKQLNLPVLLPRGMTYEGIYERPIYSCVYSQFMGDRSKRTKATLKPVKQCFIAPLLHAELQYGHKRLPVDLPA